MVLKIHAPINNQEVLLNDVKDLSVGLGSDAILSAKQAPSWMDVYSIYSA